MFLGAPGEVLVRLQLIAGSVIVQVCEPSLIVIVPLGAVGVAEPGAVTVTAADTVYASPTTVAVVNATPVMLAVVEALLTVIIAVAAVLFVPPLDEVTELIVFV